jgi:MFS superfamily sulfate permease-like transporter
MAIVDGRHEEVANGAALASFLAAGIGAFAVGFFVIVNEAGLFAAPALYGPAGGVSGRTTFAAVTWLIGWAMLHSRWKDRQLDSNRVYTATLLLTALGIVLSFPPVWRIFA